MDPNVGSLILAGGKGTRTKLTAMNKVVLNLNGKPLVAKAVELMNGIASQTVVVVGMYADTVRTALAGYNISFAVQKEQLGTGHAALCGVSAFIKEPTHVLIGYGDHMMHYKKETIAKLLDAHIKHKEALTLVVSESDYLNELRYGRIIRNSDGCIQKIVEQKDADEKTLAIKEFNAGFYCARYDFLKSSLPLITPSIVTGEYYITDLVEIAKLQGKKVLPYHVPFQEVGIGVNTLQDLEKSGKINSYGLQDSLNRSSGLQ